MELPSTCPLYATHLLLLQVVQQVLQPLRLQALAKPQAAILVVLLQVL